MSESLTEVRGCEVCGAQNLRTVLNLGLHPLCDDLVAVGEDRRCNEYPIEILFCDTCLTAHQRFQVPKDRLFPPTYHYRARHTADVLDGMRQLADAYQADFGALSGKTVLDIGCNDGSLLSICGTRGARTFGIEPTGAADDAAQRGHTIFKEYFAEPVAREFVARHGQPDLITFTNVFAHIEDLRSVVRALKILTSPKTVLVIENHYLGAIIERNQFDTFYHEHPRTYSYTSFGFIAEALGLQIANAQFPSRYGGNIRVFMSSSSGAVTEAMEGVRIREQSYGAGLARLSRQIDQWRANKGAALKTELDRCGRLEGKAFPGRAAIPIKLLGIDEALLEAVYEKPGSVKINHYVPGTRIPIRSDDDFVVGVAGDRPLINLAWHISGEINAYMRQRGFQGRIIDIVSQEDFSAT